MPGKGIYVTNLTCILIISFRPAYEFFPTLCSALKRYPRYEFLGNVSIAESAQSGRYSESSFNGFLIDIAMLAHSDFLVCTFSSNVCRIVYEMMQTIHPVDAWTRIKSLDDMYFYEGLGEHHRKVAMYAHKTTRPGEVSMDIGDVLKITANNTDGYEMVYSLRFLYIGQNNYIFSIISSIKHCI